MGGLLGADVLGFASSTMPFWGLCDRRSSESLLIAESVRSILADLSKRGYTTYNLQSGGAQFAHVRIARCGLEGIVRLLVRVEPAPFLCKSVPYPDQKYNNPSPYNNH